MDEDYIKELKHAAQLLSRVVELVEEGMEYGEAKTQALNELGAFRYHTKRHMKSMLIGTRGILG